jgi:hypothetical protein
MHYYLLSVSRNLYGSIQDVVVPLMYTEYTTRKVIVMEWIEVLYHLPSDHCIFGRMFNACIDLILEKFNVYPGSST